MIVTTTNNVEGRTIVRYFDPISSNVVLGSNIVSDIGASFIDFFGGRSESYEQKLRDMYSKVLEDIKKSAKKLRANAIIGLSIDIDEISGKGTQMFMITAVGTPVYLNEQLENRDVSSISGHQLTKKIVANRLIEDPPKIEYLTKSTAKFIAESEIEELSPILLDWMSNYNKVDDIQKENLNISFNFYKNIEEEKSKKLLYGAILNNSTNSNQAKIIINIIISMKYIDYSLINNLLNSDSLSKRVAVILLNENKEEYNKEDLYFLETVSGNSLIDLFPEIVEYTQEKGIMGTKDVWKCECGKTNKINEDSCSCGKDKRGFFIDKITPESVQAVVNDRVKVLKEFLI